MGRLPDSWLEPAADGGVQVRPSLRDRLPKEVWLSPEGSEVPPGEGLRAWYIPSPFRFCLRCRVSYEQSRGKADDENNGSPHFSLSGSLASLTVTR